MMLLAMAVAVSTAFAKVTYTNEFESASCTNDFVVTGSDNESEVVDYNGTQPRFAQPYPCDGYGEKYLSLDTGDATLWRAVNTTGKIYFDMAMQFNPSATTPELTNDVKIAIYQNSTSNIVILAGDGNGGVSTNVTTTQIAPGEWGRITVAANEGSNGLVFQVRLDGTLLATAGAVNEFPSMTSSTTIASVGFSGTGALDDFVARTTDPYLQGGVAAIEGEFYASYNDALKEALEGAPIAVSNCTTGVVTDGTAEHPYEIADANALKILAAAVQSNPASRSLSYVQTADITWTSADGAFEGIGHYSGTIADRIYFTGVYDGCDHKISGMVFTARTYAGIFNQLHTGAEIKNLTVDGLAFEAGATGEYGGAIVGVCGDSSPSAGSNVLSRLAFINTTGNVLTNTHNCAGIVVNVAGGYAAINDCTNNVDIVCDRDKFGGICCMTGGHIDFNGCVNNGDLVLVPRAGYTTSGSNGCGGMHGFMQGGGNLHFQNCVNAGAFVDNSGLTTAKHGQYFGHTAGNQTVEDLGGNKFLVSGGQLIGSMNVSKITGFEYAVVVDDVGMTVPQADLAANAEYLVLRDVAASATPVATLAAANDYIAFNTNGYNFAGTVAGSSTVAVTESTSGSVITFTGVAGVASVNDVAYATFDEAVDAVATAPEGHQYVELLADAEVNFDEAGTTLAVKENAHTLTVTTTGDIAVSSTPDPSTGITTYTSADGVAAVTHEGTTTWYATFAAAYDAAHAITTGDYPYLTVKVGGDFTPAISYSQYFRKIVFQSTVETPVTVNLKNAAGTSSMIGFAYEASENVKLVLPSDFNAENTAYLTGGCTIEVPEGVTLTLAPGSSGTLVNIGGLVGAGTLVAPTDTGALNNFIANGKYSGWLKAATWTGTLQCSGDSKSTSFSNIANANASIRFCGFTNYTHNATSASGFAAIELVGDGLSLAGDDSAQNQVWTFTNALKGDGALTLADNTGSVLLSGDVSGFTGNVTASGTSSAITFGSSTTGNGQRIVVGGGESVTNAAGATWSAANVIVRGELVANGTMSATKLWGDSGTGVYRANNSAAAIAVASSWNGTYYANFDSGDVSFAFDVATSASATTVINGANGAFSGYPKSNGAAPNVAGSVVLNANWTIGNGWATNKNTGASNATTFANLSGGGNLTVNGTTSYTDPIYYCITTLDGYTGTLGGNRGAFVVGKVNVATQPTNGAIVVKTNIGVNGSINDNVPLYVGGTDTTKTLTYKADGAYGAGLYYIDSTPTDPWNTPASDEGVADALAADGLTTETGAISTVAEFTDLVEYITNTLTNVSVPADMSANQKANAIFCYALNSSTIPDDEITSSDVTIDAITQPDASGAMTLTVAIAGVTVGETVDPALVATVVSAKGGTSIGSMVAAGVATTNYGSSNGKVVVTVTPNVASINPAPTTFFTSAVITK